MKKKKVKIENMGVLQQIRKGKTYAFTKEQKLKFAQMKLEEVLYAMETNKLHNG